MTSLEQVKKTLQLSEERCFVCILTERYLVHGLDRSIRSSGSSVSCVSKHTLRNVFVK